MKLELYTAWNSATKKTIVLLVDHNGNYRPLISPAPDRKNLKAILETCASVVQEFASRFQPTDVEICINHFKDENLESVLREVAPVFRTRV